MTQNEVEGIDLNPLVRLAMGKYELYQEDDIKVDVWSNRNQTFINTGSFRPKADDKNFLPEDELIVDGDEKTYLILRFKNSTGNVIDFSEYEVDIFEEDLVRAQAALSIDKLFKN